MFFRSSILICTLILMLASCKPRPLDIEIPQQSGALAVSSACPDASTVLVSASYSLNSLYDLMDTGRSEKGTLIPENLLLDTAVVILQGTNGSRDTLHRIREGIWGRRDLNLQAGMSYQLSIRDCRSGKTASATTTFLPRAAIDSIRPERIIRSTDTLITLHARIHDVREGSYYFISYGTLREARELSGAIPAGKRMTTPRQLELFGGGDARSGTLEKTITTSALPTDTLLVQVAEIDRASFNYLSAYKRSGSFINQLTGEPINLPGNITGGFGLFALHQPLYRLFDLKKI